MRGGGIKCQSVARSGAATADFKLLALVFYGLGCTKNLDAKFAIRFPDDFHGVLVLHDVAGRGVNGDLAARTIASLVEKRQLVESEHPKEKGNWLALPGLSK